MGLADGLTLGPDDGDEGFTLGNLEGKVGNVEGFAVEDAVHVPTPGVA